METPQEFQQWQLPNNSKVKLPSGEVVTFLKMDGRYAKWNEGGKFVTGNFKSFKKVGNYFEVIE